MKVTYRRIVVPHVEGKRPNQVVYRTDRIGVAMWARDYAVKTLLKDRLKSTGLLFWWKGGRTWHMAPTPLAVRTVMEAARTFRLGPVEQVLDDPVLELSRRAATIDDVEVGPLPRAVLEPYEVQRVGSHVVGQLDGSMLAYDMGVGKTKAIIDAIVHYDLRRALVICPHSVIRTWEQEAAVHFPDDFSYRLLALEKGSMAKRLERMRLGLEFAGHDAVLVAINYEAVTSPHSRSLRDALAERRWDLLVVDECHRASNWSAKMTKFLQVRMMQKARHRVGLTGTPLGSGPIEGWGEFLYLDPGLFGESLTMFRSKHCVMGGFEGKQILEYVDVEGFREKMSKLAIRARIDDVVELPDKRDIELPVELPAATMRVYRELRDEFIADWREGVIVGDNVLKRLLRLQQITSGYCVVTDPRDRRKQSMERMDTAKSDRLSELLTDMGSDEAVVVFCRFVPDLYEVLRVCALLERGGRAAPRPAFMLGDGKDQREAWLSDIGKGSGPVIATQIQAGGVGINEFVAARYGVYYSLGFDGRLYSQSRARILRPGQKRSVIYYHLIAPGTVDRMVYRALAKKKELVDAVVEELVNAADLTGDRHEGP